MGKTREDFDIIIQEDIIIPKGTVLTRCDGETVEYVSGNYKATLGFGKDTCLTVVLGTEDIIALDAPQFKFEEK